MKFIYIEVLFFLIESSRFNFGLYESLTEKFDRLRVNKHNLRSIFTINNRGNIFGSNFNRFNPLAVVNAVAGVENHFVALF